MEKYNYYEAVYNDVKEAIAEEADYIDVDILSDRDEFETWCNENLFVYDSVTGNASGSYTFNAEVAKEYVMDNLDLYNEAVSELSGDPYDEAGRVLLDGNWESADVTIRCYILNEAISDIMDEYENNGVFEEFKEDYKEAFKRIA